MTKTNLKRIIKKVIPQSIRNKIRFLIDRVIGVVSLILSLPLSLIIYLLNIKILVNCRTGGMGHLAMEPGWFLVKTYSDKKENAKRCILLVDGSVANQGLAELLKKHFIIFHYSYMNRALRYVAQYPYIRKLDIGVAPTEGARVNQSSLEERNKRYAQMMTDVQNYRYTHQKAILSILPEWKEKGMENLDALGITENDWFVCLHAGEVSKNARYGYDLYRRQKISDYCGVIEYIAKRGGKVVRMGDKDVPDIQDGIPVIDYPKSKVKSDWMDLFLISECRYFIGCQSGLQWVAMLFGKPQILTNIIPWQEAGGFDGDIYLPKIIRNKETGEFQSLKECLKNGLLIQGPLPEIFEAIPNDNKDIIHAVEEMESYLNTNKLPEPNHLQILWKKSFPPLSQCKYSDVRISASFIGKYKEIFFKETF